jgi:putative glutamine amidotransferase
MFHYAGYVKHIRVGLTSPLVDKQVPTDDMEVTRHRRTLEREGAEPIILKNTMDPLRVVEEFGLRGVVFSGGGDVSATRYAGDEKLANSGVDPQRDAFEFALMAYMFACALPVLAVCRGMQIANVLLGGTLIEDIRHHLGAGHALPHHQVKDAGMTRAAYAHEIAVASGTVLHEIAGVERVAINSFHHQALGKIAQALQVTAHADDGVVEAVEFAPDYANGCRGFFIGVQWHPEALPEDRLSQGLYMRFVDACVIP